MRDLFIELNRAAAHSCSRPVFIPGKTLMDFLIVLGSMFHQDSLVPRFRRLTLWSSASPNNRICYFSSEQFGISAPLNSKISYFSSEHQLFYFRTKRKETGFLVEQTPPKPSTKLAQRHTLVGIRSFSLWRMPGRQYSASSTIPLQSKRSCRSAAAKCISDHSIL